MKANELRIGNWVIKTKTGEPIQIRPTGIVNFSNQEGNQMGTRMYEPFPITAAWLWNLGFIETEPESDVFSIGLPNGNATDLSIEAKNGDFREVSIVRRHIVDGTFSGAGEFDYVYLNPISSIHQLQNIYFSLTGKELEYQTVTA